MSFGWSVGDIISGINLSIKIYQAFNDGRENAPAQYHVLINEFETFHGSFVQLHQLLVEYDQNMYMGYPAILGTLKKCEDYLHSYEVVDVPFSKASPAQIVKRAALQVNWALVGVKQIDFLRKELAGHARIISICSAAATFRGILEIRAQNKELREQNQKILLSTQHIISRLDQSPSAFQAAPIPPFGGHHVADIVADIGESHISHAQTLHRKLEALKEADRLLQAEEERLRLEGAMNLSASGDALDSIQRDQLIKARTDLDTQAERLRNYENRWQRLPHQRTETLASTSTSNPPSLIHDGMDTRPLTSPMSLLPHQGPTYRLSEGSLNLPEAAMAIESPLSVSPKSFSPGISPSPIPAIVPRKRTDTASSDAFLAPYTPSEGILWGPLFTTSHPRETLSSPDSSPRQLSSATFSPLPPPQSRRSTIMSTVSLGHQWTSLCLDATITSRLVPPLTCGACTRRCKVELLWTERDSGGLTLKAECLASRACLLVHTFPSDAAPIPHIEHSRADPASALTVSFNNNTNCGQVRFPAHRPQPGPAQLSYRLASKQDYKKFQELVYSMNLLATFDITLVKTDRGDGGRTETLRLWQPDQLDPSTLMLMAHGRMNPRAAEASYFQESKSAFVALASKDVKTFSVRLHLQRPSPGAGRKDSFSSFSSGESMGSTRSSVKASLHRPRWIEFHFESRDERREFCRYWEPSLSVS